MFKKVLVVMLTTNEKANLWFNKYSNQLHYDKKLNIDHLFANNKYLYFLSDEEIKVGDWYYKEGLSIDKCINEEHGEALTKDKYCKKIIATTDKLIIGCNQGLVEYEDKIIDCNDYLPQPSQSFIQKYVDEYNKGNIITDVMVEYWAHTEENIQYKVNSKDNTITIKKVKNIWNREEVIQLLSKFQDDLGDNCPGIETEIEKWIKENV